MESATRSVRSVHGSALSGSFGDDEARTIAKHPLPDLDTEDAGRSGNPKGRVGAAEGGPSDHDLIAFADTWTDRSLVFRGDWLRRTGNSGRGVALLQLDLVNTWFESCRARHSLFRLAPLEFRNARKSGRF